MKDFLKTKDVAALLGKSEWYVKQLRRAKSGPPYYKIGKSVRYERGEVMQWLEDLRVPA
jgi:predicted DNA-binding transcriptional regulator AlpA